MKTTTLKYQEVKDYMNSQGYEILQDFVEGWSKKIKMKCPKNHIIEMTWGNFKTNNRRCKFCSIENRSISKENIISKLSKEGYELVEELGKVDSRYRKIKVKCNKGHVYDVEIRKFNEGRRCPVCSDTAFDFEYVKSFVEKEGYTLISDKYTNVCQKLEMICPNGHNYHTNFHNFKNGGRRCPRCSQSKGESFISNILSENNVKFVREYIFKDCKHIRPLPFDFYLPDFDILIEYDGEQHYSLKHSYSEESFIATKKNDTIKNEYCESNNIKLIRIPYWDFDNIEHILRKELNLDRENFND